MESKVWADVGLYHLPAEIQATVQVLSLIYKMINAPSIAQTVKSLPAMQETWVWSLGWEDPFRREWLPTPVFLPGELYGQRSLVGLQRVGRD